VWESNASELLSRAPWLVPTFASLFGLLLGSFLNVVIHRLPLKESIVSPRSRCPQCRRPIPAFENVPIVSWVVLRGRCRGCAAKISFRYPAVEALTGGAALLAALRHGPSLELALEFSFVAAIIALVFIDYDHQILPDVITLPGAAIGLVASILREPIDFSDSIEGAALGAGSLFLVSEVYLRVRGVEGLGFGDVKMMAMVGAFLGWKGVLLTLFVGSLVGSLVGVVVLARAGRDGDGLRTKLPFGTFLGVAAIACVYVGPRIIDWYSGLF
jgi:leader peptidase (prepilin peptidase)/N-methyltransferase